MQGIRPSTIVIAKSKMDLKAIQSIVDEDPHCWTQNEQGGCQQVSCHVMFCWFHAKKAWVENLLPQVIQALPSVLVQVNVIFWIT